jgi:hypothetical protein
MKRRTFLLAGPAILATSLVATGDAEPAMPASVTRWKVRTSVGFDAIAFLGPLSGVSLYLEYYSADAQAFAPLLPTHVRSQIKELWQSAQNEGFGLLGPNLQVLFSTGGNDASISTIIAALRTKDQSILPTYRASRYWNESDWAWFSKATPALITVFSAMQAANFAAFRAARTHALQARVAEVQKALNDFDVISWQSKLTGRTFDPVIEVVLLQFVKPHGIKVQGQTFLQSADYDTNTTVRIAAHEMLHPPFDKNGPAARAALDVFGGDPLITTIVRDHDPQWGYGTLEGMLDEDLVQALDQMISEALGVGRNPADRWREADDGMHVIAGGLYGLLREDHWTDHGGSIESWLQQAAMSGRLESRNFHAVAARVLERSPDRLWPLTGKGHQ